jgi:HSP20 family protein
VVAARRNQKVCHLRGREQREPEGWTALHRESTDAPFELALAHNNAIDPEKILAGLA